MSEVLSSWKDVAAHLGKSVRTVQRWEAELGLPVHRPNGRQQRIILAYPDELKQWVGSKSAPHAQPDTLAKARLEKNKSRLAAQMKKLQTLSEDLRRRTATTLDRVQRARTLSRRAPGSPTQPLRANARTAS